LKYGHLEQLCRLKGAPEVNRWCKELEDHAGRIMSVTDLKRRIDHQSPALSLAHFDIEKAGCVACAHNSDVQKVLFAVDQSEKTICTNPVCFKKKQKNYLAANWAKSALRKKFRTNGYVFNEDWNWMRNDNFYTAKEAFPECKDCERFVTVLHATGEVYYERGCLDKTCKSKLSQARKAGGRGAGSNPEAGAAPGPRVAWHGQHFREIFYQEKIRDRVEVLLLSDPEAWQDHKILRMLLFGLLCHAGSTLGAWFAKRNMLTDDTEGSYYFLDRDQALARILDMSREDVGFDLAGAALELILSSNAAPEQRRAIGELLGIDLASEWRVTEEYLTKKTTPELLAFGETSGIFADQAALAFVSGLGRRSFKACKKSELVKVFLESGAELVGKVPAEILNKG
jgi:hypothetical protein